jgi:hypothetical protein
MSGSRSVAAELLVFDTRTGQSVRVRDSKRVPGVGGRALDPVLRDR